MITQFCGIVPLTGVVKSTTESMQLYVDGSVGDDANNGLSPAAPKKTLEAVFDLLPFFIGHNCTINCSGTFTDAGIPYINKYVDWGVNLVVDGGDALAVVDDNSGSNYTITASGTNYITDSSASWTTDQHAGVLIEILSGSQAGRLRMIQGNTSNTLTPIRNFSADPGVGATFRIVEYATNFYGNSDFSGGQFTFFGAGNVSFQRLSATGSKCALWFWSNTTNIQVRSCTLTGTYSNILNISRSVRGSIAGSYIDPATYNTITTDFTGVGSPNSKVIFKTCESTTIYALLANQLDLTNCALLGGGRFGCRTLSGAVVTTCRPENTALHHFQSNGGYATTKFDNPGGVGLVFDGCDGLNVNNVTINNCGSHAIELKRSYIHATGAVIGSGNAGAGVRAHLGSALTIKNGAPPTLTGTIGDLSFDGTTQASTWAAIDAGTPASNTTEMSMCKEV